MFSDPDVRIEFEQKKKIVAGRVRRLTITRQLVRMIHTTVARLCISYNWYRCLLFFFFYRKTKFNVLCGELCVRQKEEKKRKTINYSLKIHNECVFTAWCKANENWPKAVRCIYCSKDWLKTNYVRKSMRLIQQVAQFQFLCVFFFYQTYVLMWMFNFFFFRKQLSTSSSINATFESISSAAYQSKWYRESTFNWKFEFNS